MDCEARWGVTSPVIEPYEFSAGRSFETRFAAATKQEVVYGAHYAYDTVHVLVAAIRNAKTVDGKALSDAVRARLS